MRSATIAGNVYEVSSDGATILVQEVAVMPPHLRPQLPGVKTTNHLRLPAATWRELLPIIAAEIERPDADLQAAGGGGR